MEHSPCWQSLPPDRRARPITGLVTMSLRHQTTRLSRLNRPDSSFNPERGVYKHLDLLESRDGRILRDKCSLARKQGFSIVYTQAILPRTGELPLDTIAAGFDAIRACGAKAIVRFYYIPDDECAAPCVDPPVDTILQHIEDLKAPLAEHSDVIMAVQAGLVGPWGEWHGSTLSNPPDYAALRTILLALIDAVPATRMVQVRKPSHRHAIFSTPPDETVSAANAIAAPGGPAPFDGYHKSRTGHHNDCFLGTITDYSTFSPYGTPEYWQERKYISWNTRSTPMGGETCNLHKRYDPSIPGENNPSMNTCRVGPLTKCPKCIGHI